MGEALADLASSVRAAACGVENVASAAIRNSASVTRAEFFTVALFTVALFTVAPRAWRACFERQVRRNQVRRGVKESAGARGRAGVFALPFRRTAWLELRRKPGRCRFPRRTR